MANSRIVFVPQTTYALSLDGAHYLSLDAADFNLGAGDFGVDLLFYADPAITAEEKLLAGKTPANLNNLAGWQVFYDAVNQRAGLRLNDGSATPVTVVSDNDSFAKGLWHWLRADADRDGNGVIYKNGAAVKTGAISTRPGSLDNTELFQIGALGTAFFKGKIDHLRVDKGRSLPASWHTAEWERLYLGIHPKLLDFPALWKFENSLVDESANLYIPTYQPSGSPGYTSDSYLGSRGTIDYTFKCNPNWGDEFSYVDLDGRERLLGGDLAVSGRARKIIRSMTIEYVLGYQLAVLLSMWENQTAFDFYPDAALPREGSFYLTAPPDVKTHWRGVYEVQLDMEEI